MRRRLRCEFRPGRLACLALACLLTGSGCLLPRWVHHDRDDVHASVVRLGGCTATRIAPNVVLTAAHCLCGNAREPIAGAEAEELLSIQCRDCPNYRDRHICGEAFAGSSRVAPDYLECVDEYGRANSVLSLGDIALVEVATASEDLSPIAHFGRLDRRRSYPVRVVGYGLPNCRRFGRQGINVPNQHSSCSVEQLPGDPDVDLGDGWSDGSGAASALDVAPSCRDRYYSRSRAAAFRSRQIHLTRRFAARVTHGDSGGPLMVRQDGEFLVAGVTTVGATCHPFDAMFENLWRYEAWVRERAHDLQYQHDLSTGVDHDPGTCPWEHPE